MCSTRHLDWMMSKKANHENVAASVALLLFLLIPMAAGTLQGISGPENLQRPGDMYVQVAGDVVRPGVYSVPKGATVQDALLRAGGLSGEAEGISSVPETTCFTGQHIQVMHGEGTVRVRLSEMTAYHKITLGIPISLNRESPEGLMAVPGIGEKLARGIVSARARQGGFRELRELMSIPGIGPTLYRRILVYLTL